jgi:threonine dehydrogenase-like Zn-dependent dehydrogenase
MRGDVEGRRAPGRDPADAVPGTTVVTVRWRDGRATLWIDGEVDLDSAVTISRAVRHLVDAHVEAPLGDAPGAYEMFQAKKDGAIKVVLDPTAS